MVERLAGRAERERVGDNGNTVIDTCTGWSRDFLPIGWSASSSSAGALYSADARAASGRIGWMDGQSAQEPSGAGGRARAERDDHGRARVRRVPPARGRGDAAQ